MVDTGACDNSPGPHHIFPNVPLSSILSGAKFICMSVSSKINTRGVICPALVRVTSLEQLSVAEFSGE